MAKCQWCGKRELPKHPQWEQLHLTTDEWSPLCSRCATKRLNNPYNALIQMRRIEYAQAVAQAEGGK